MDDLIERLRQYAQADDLHKDERDTLDAAADALEAAREDAWQPIETAPKDGTAILIYAPKFYFGAGVYVAWWVGNWWEVCTEGATDYPYSDTSATHWMPLPAPPKEARNG